MNDRNIKAKKIVDELEKSLGNGQPVSFKIAGSDGKEFEVSKEDFAKFIEGDGNHVQSPKVSKETLTYIIKSDINGKTYSVERKGKDGFCKESYYQPRSEEDKKRLIEQGKKRREEIKKQEENSSSQDVKSDIDLNKLSQEVNQTQRNNDNKSKYIVCGGLISLLLLLGIVCKAIL